MDYKQKIEEKRQKLVNTLIEFIENNPTQWEAGWYSMPSKTPINGKTQKKYNGLNAFYLCVLSAMKGYKDPRWVTYNQAKELGANVRAGEKSSEVFYWSYYDKETKQPYDAKTCEGMTYEERKKYWEDNVRPVIKFYQVFNAAQCDNMPEYELQSTPEMEAEERRRQNAVIEQIITNSVAPVSYDGGSRAYYSPSKDSIHLPEIKDFKTMQDYYATALHEIAHSTGHESRLNRNLTGFFGTPDYAKEELRAELASVFMQVEFGISVEGKHFENHGAYLASWLKSVKDNQKEFFSAASDAEKITNYVVNSYFNAKVEKKEEQHSEDNADYDEQNVEPKFEANMSFAKQVDAVLSGADTTSTHLKVMGTPLILRQLGAQNIPVLMTARHLKNIVAESGDDANINYHGIDADLVKKLPEMLSDPVMVMDSLTREDSVVIVTSAVDKENRPIIGAIKFDGIGRQDQQIIKANILLSVYGRNQFNDFIQRNFDAKSILYWDKEKSQELSVNPGVQFPDVMASLDSNVIIRQAKAFVNTLEGQSTKKDEKAKQRIDKPLENGVLLPEVLAARQQMLNLEWNKYGENYYAISNEKILISNEDDERDNGNIEVDGQAVYVIDDYGNVVQNQTGQKLQSYEIYEFLPYYRQRDYKQIPLEELQRIANGRANKITMYAHALKEEERKLGKPVHNDLYFLKIAKQELDNHHADLHSVRPYYGEYMRTQVENPEAIVLKRVGDFYEVMGDKAAHVAETLELTLTGRDVGLSDRVAMCGFLYHFADECIAKLRESSDVVVDDKYLVKRRANSNDNANNESSVQGEKRLRIKSQVSGWEDWYTDRIKNKEAREAAEWLIENNYENEKDVKSVFYDRQTSSMSDDPNAENNDEAAIISVANKYKSRQAQKADEGKAAVSEQGKKPTVVNFYAGPGAGKTTAALELTAELKKAGLNVEYVSEYAKELVLEGKTELLSDQQHVTDEQYHRLDRLRDSVDVIVTDSPVLLGIVYGADRIDDAYRRQLRSYYDSFQNIDLHIERKTEYQTEGRVQTEQEAKELDTAISQMLQAQNINCRNYMSEAIHETVELVKQTQQARQVEQAQQAENTKEKYILEFLLDYSNELLLSKDLEEIGYKVDHSTAQNNQAVDEAAYKAKLPYWVNEIRYTSPDGKVIRGLYGKVNNDILIEKTDITQFTLDGFNRKEAEEVANVLRSFDIDVTLKQVEQADTVEQAQGVDTAQQVEQAEPVVQADATGQAQQAEQVESYAQNNKKGSKRMNLPKIKNWEEIDIAKGGYVETSYEFFETIYDVPLMKAQRKDFWYIGYIRKGKELKTKNLFTDENAARQAFKSVKRFQESELRSKGLFKGKSVEYLREWLREFGSNPYIGDSIYRDAALKELEQAQKAETVEQAQKAEQAQQVRQAQQVGQGKWNKIPLNADLIGAERGKSTQLKMPDGEYSSFVFFAPTKFVQHDEKSGTVQLSVNDDFKYNLIKGNQRVELTGSELRQALAGREVGKRAQRVLSEANAQTLTDIYRNVPEEMRQYPNWCVYRTRWNDEKGKYDKQIFSPVLGLNKDGKMQWASIDKPETWATFDVAMKFAEENDCAGLVFALDGKSGISCIDLDKAIVKDGKLNDKPTDRTEGELSALAARLSNELRDTYIETSASGNGLHIFVNDDLLSRGKYKNRAETPDGEIEVYDDRRFMSMTGKLRSNTQRIGKSPIATTSLIRELLGEKVAEKQVSVQRPRRHIDNSDSAVIERMRKSKRGIEFEALYRGENVTGDNSRSDFKLLNMLAFFTDCDESQMERIFKSSGLYREEKGEAYLQRSVSKACATLQTRMSNNAFFGGRNNDGGRGNSK